MDGSGNRCRGDSARGGRLAAGDTVCGWNAGRASGGCAGRYPDCRGGYTSSYGHRDGDSETYSDKLGHASSYRYGDSDARCYGDGHRAGCAEPGGSHTNGGRRGGGRGRLDRSGTDRNIYGVTGHSNEVVTVTGFSNEDAVADIYFNANTVTHDYTPTNRDKFCPRFERF